MLKTKEAITVYAIGSIGYRFIEILWRGRTHWTMGIVGGISLLFIYFLEKRSRMNLYVKALISAFFITFSEFVSGVLINRIFKLNVWDYSNMRYNLLGQISLIYSFLWYFLCIPAHLMCRILRHRIVDVLPKSSLENLLKGGRVFGR